MQTWLIESFLHRYADQSVVSLGIILKREMHVVRGNHLYAMLLRHLQQKLIDFLFERIYIAVGILLECLVALQLEVIVVAKRLLIP